MNNLGGAFWQSPIMGAIVSEVAGAADFPCPSPGHSHHGFMDVDVQAGEIIGMLGLLPHPEGGYFRETFRSSDMVTLADGRERSAGTSIYYLLPQGTFSALHKVAADEIWHFDLGAPLELLTITPAGDLEVHLLGCQLDAGQRPQYTVPSGVWQAARALPSSGGFTLVGCTVSPGFDFADFEMPGRAALGALFPQHQAIIDSFTRDEE